MSTFPIHRKPSIPVPVLKQEDRQLHLSWLKIPEVKYTLLHSRDGRQNFEKYLATFASKYTYMAERPICQHKFKVQPQIGSCFGETTPTIGVEIKTMPANMKSLLMEPDAPNC